MKKALLTAALMIVVAASAMAQGYGILFGELEVNETNAADIFGNGMASYDVDNNMLVLQDGFEYRLSRGLVTVNTGREFRIVLEGNAEMSASLEIGDPVILEAVDEGSLKITSNISGSALKCQSLSVMPDVVLDLLSRNSSDSMHALDCEELRIDEAIIHAEVTTAQLAVAVKEMALNGCWLQRPRGGFINEAYGGICFGDGTPAKFVRIGVEGFGVEEMEDVQNDRIKKVFEDGQIVIIKDGKRYDVTGREL